MRPLLLVLLCAVPMPATGQEPSGPPFVIRVTGAERVEIPGVISMDRDGISGRESTRGRDAIALQMPGEPHRLLVPRPGRRLTGKTYGRDGMFLPLDGTSAERTGCIPLQAVDKLEISRGRRNRLARALAGLALGLATSVAITYVGIHAAERPLEAVVPTFFAAVAGGAAVGTIIGARDPERWERVSLDQLPALTAGARAPVRCGRPVGAGGRIAGD